MKLRNMVLIALALGLISALVTASSPSWRWKRWKPTLKPVSLPSQAGPVQIEFTVDAFKQPKEETESLRAEFEIEVLGDIIVNHPTEWTAQIPWDQPYREIIDVVVLPTDTGGVRIQMAAPGRAGVVQIYLWATDKGIISHSSDPRRFPPSRERKSEYEMFMDTASAQTANEMIDVYFSLKVPWPGALEKALELVGDEMKPWDGPGFEGPEDSLYTATIPRKVLYELFDLGLLVGDAPPPRLTPRRLLKQTAGSL